MSTELIPGRCDICRKRDGFHKHNLQKCHTCGVAVHELCYGLAPSKFKNQQWECLACQSLRWKPVKGLRQKERPKECVLCGVSDGIHAMHPLYDREGKRGQHLILPAGADVSLDEEGEMVHVDRPRRLAWVHSLCAYFVGVYRQGKPGGTGGCIYTCDKDGYAEDDDEENEMEDDEDEDETVESSRDISVEDKEDKDSDRDEGFNSDHHFVFNNDSGWPQELNKNIRKVKCTLCGLPDNGWRIPVQCVANDEDELPVDFRERHEDSEPCYQGMHVGCAMWMNGGSDRSKGEDKMPKRVFYYPGANPAYPELLTGSWDEDPVASCYCNRHARDIFMNNPNRQEKKTKHQKRTFSGGDVVVTAQAIQEQRLKQRRQHEVRRIKQQQQQSLKGRTTSQLQQQSSKEQRKSAIRKTSPSATNPKVTKALRTGRVNVANENTNNKRRSVEDWFPEVTDDIMNVVRKAQESDSNVKDATTERKLYWRDITGLSKGDFKELWGRVRTDVQNKMYDDSEPNPWSYLFVPQYRGATFAFGEWDSMEEIHE